MSLNWVRLALGRGKYHAVVSTVMNLVVQYNAGKFLIC